PAPCTPHPTPETRTPAPCTPHPTPETRTPAPCTPHPTPEPRNPKPGRCTRATATPSCWARCSPRGRG
ncbi:hypothetical protein T484DRAFT_1626262, partial [Baffinella frigidus]